MFGSIEAAWETEERIAEGSLCAFQCPNSRSVQSIEFQLQQSSFSEASYIFDSLDNPCQGEYQHTRQHVECSDQGRELCEVRTQ